MRPHFLYNMAKEFPRVRRKKTDPAADAQLPERSESVYCRQCRQYHNNGERSCPDCGQTLEAYARVSVRLKPEDLAAGVRISVPFPGMYRPATVKLLPGLTAGQTLSVQNARFKAGDDYDVGLLEIRLKVEKPEPHGNEPEEAEAADAKKKGKKKRSKKGGGFWAHAAACLSVLPVTVLMTLLLYYFTARSIFEAAGRDALLVLGALSFALLLLIRLTVPKRTDTAHRNALIITVSLALALGLRYVPPLLGVDLASAAASLHESVYPAEREAPQATPAPAANVTEPAVYAAEPAAPVASAPATDVPATASPARSAAYAEAARIIPNFEHRYLLNQLSTEELENFTALYNSISSFSPVCVFPHAISRDGVDLLTTLILTECPELMQVDFTAGYYSLSLFNGHVRSMDIPYVMTEQEYRVKYATSYSIVCSAAARTAGMDILEKEQYVYELIVNACSYSTVAPDASNAYGALVGGHAKCDGISLAAKWILEEAGVTAVVVTGQEKGMTVGHAWNAVLIDGVFCHVDITNDTENDGALLYPAFNVPDHVLTDIYPYDEVFASRFPLPSVQGYEYSRHYRDGCFIAAGANASKVLESKVRSLYKKGGGSFTLQFETEADYRTFLTGLDGRLSDLYSNKLGTGGRYAYTTLDNFRTVRITLVFS